MKILYLSCHAILEYDELKLFEELGIDYFSLGSYIDPKNPVDPIRPALTALSDVDLIKHAPLREQLTREFVEPFDTIIIMHVPEWIEANWEQIKHKRVIWRTIGQSTPAIERRLWPFRQQGLKVVRYSPKEANLADNIGCDKIIRFYKDPDEFYGWKGAGNEIITIAQNMKHRDRHCNYETFEKVIEGFNGRVYGNKNEESGPLSGGFLTYEEMKQKLRDARAYIYTGTQPACYTLGFIEAMMTGIPIISIGLRLGNSLDIAGDMFEPPQIIQNASNGFVSDEVGQLRRYAIALLEDKRLAERVGEMGRQTAIQLFGKDVIKEQWRNFLCKL